VTDAVADATFGRSPPKAFVDDMIGQSLKAPARVWRETFASLLHYDDSAEVGQLDVATLVVWGDEDAITDRPATDALARSMRNSKLLVYEGIGHTPHWEDPVRFAQGTTDEIIVGNGDSELLVAPVHVQESRRGVVQFPAGGDWIDYWTGKVYRGGTGSAVNAPLDRVPIFVKAGSIIPMGPEIHYVDEKPADPLTLDIYPSAKSSYTLYEDDGMSNGYQNGQFARTPMACSALGPDLVVDVSAAQGDYQGKLARRTYLLKINRPAGTPASVSRNGATVTRENSREAFESAAEGWFNDQAGATVWVKFSTPTAVSAKVILHGVGIR